MATVYVKSTPILIDDADVDLFNSHRWWMVPLGYAATKVRINGKRRTMLLHRVLLGNPPEPQIDHINRNKLDNRRANLRACDRSTNMRNVAPRKGKPARLRGVTFNRRRGKWQVVLRKNGRLTWGGYHDTPEQAACVAAPHFEGIAP